MLLIIIIDEIENALRRLAWLGTLNGGRLPIGTVIAVPPLEFSCTPKQAPGCSHSQHNAHDSANCEIKGARIEQNLKCVTH